MKQISVDRTECANLDSGHCFEFYLYFCILKSNQHLIIYSAMQELQSVLPVHLRRTTSSARPEKKTFLT